MIRVKRPASAPANLAAALAKTSQGGKTELDLARVHYQSSPPPKKAFDFKRYRDRVVCLGLDELFVGKCAYCESPYRAVEARNVEHFRPKGGVRESKSHPGYWWLAADWTNLLPSCPACNQVRKRVPYTPGMTLEDVEEALKRTSTKSSGKGNAFPVRGHNWVTAESGDLSIEDPLLINPCERDPIQHLEWTFGHDTKQPIWRAAKVLPILRPLPGADGKPDPYAAASIAIYGLNRPGMVRERAERLAELQRACQPVVDALQDLAREQDPTSARSAELGQRLAAYKATLYDYTGSEKIYSAMASAFLHEFDRQLKLHLTLPNSGGT